MGKEWDKLGRNHYRNDIKKDCSLEPRAKENPWQKVASGYGFSKKNLKCKKCDKYKWDYLDRKCQCENPDYDYRQKEDRILMQLWHTQWLTEAYRVLKPGGSMLVMGGTRTSHRLACAIEDSGFIIKDTLMWIYGSGFPKAQDLGKMIDKRNGRNQEIYKPFAKYLKKKRLEKKLSMSEIDKRLGTNTQYSWYEGRLLGIQLPTMGYYLKLKEILNLDNRFDKLIEREEAERKIIGIQYKRTKQNWMPNSKDNNTYISNPVTGLAKHWDGFKVGGIKPAYEPIIWAVKPPEGSYVDNVLKWNVGAVNVDECRISLTGDENLDAMQDGNIYGGHGIYSKAKQKEVTLIYKPKGRFPANVILSHHPECVQVGVKKIDSGRCEKPSDCNKKGNTSFDSMRGNRPARGYGIEQVESWDCHPDCAVRLLDEQSGDLKSHGGGKGQYRGGNFAGGYATDENCIKDNGGASRFFYCAKASRGERNAGLEGMEDIEKHGHYAQDEWSRKNMGNLPDEKRKPVKNNHPTVKPIKLFEYLIKLVTREGQIVLDPFIGSGTTAIAAHNAGRKCVGIEKEDEYLEIAKRRIDYWQHQPKQMEIGEHNASI